MNRGKLILTIWEYGMEHPNFSIIELEEYLERKPFGEQLSKEDINFGIAYVKKNFIKSKDLDEYLIDQSSITGYLTHKQNKITTWSIVIAVLSLIVAAFSLFVVWRKDKEEGVRNSSAMSSTQIQGCQGVQNDTHSVFVFKKKDAIEIRDNQVHPL